MPKTNLILRTLLALIFFTAEFLPIPQAHSQVAILTPEYMGTIQQRVNAYFNYPLEAKTKGWEGIVKIKFTLAEDGRIKQIDVAESSGYPLLDAVAILAVKDASPYPFPKDYNYRDEGELEMVLPVNYVQHKITTIPALQKAPSLPILSIAEAPVAEPEPIKENPEQKLTLQKEEPPAFLPAQREENNTAAPLQEAKIVPEEAAAEIPNFNFQSQLALPEGIKQGPIETPKELTSFIDLALKNNQPTKVAAEEVDLAKIKVLEAQRGLFPALKGQFYNTDGKTQGVLYQEWETKLQIDQPIYYGGRLQDTVKQAKTNLEITRKNYDRLKLDVVQKAETSYYNLIASRMHLNQQEILLKESKELLGKIEKLAKAGMIIPLEVNSVRSWVEQLEFKIDGIKHDLYMAELTFAQVLNIQSKPVVETELIEARRLNLDLNTCLSAAYKFRPEIYLSEQLVKFNNYGQKIETTKNKALTVDFSSSFGYYQGHYKTEPWKQSSNWYVGLKGNMPFGASTANGSFSSEHTRPRFGQTSPTESTSLTGEFNLLDNMKRISDKKKSDIDLFKSISDFNETFKTITFEVQDAFLSYQKAVLQLNTAQSEMKFRRNEAEVTKIRAMVGETSLSNAMESLYSLSDAQTKYIQALANYQISLANLKKATGYGIQL